MNELDVNLLEIFNYLPANIYLKDKQGKFTWCNANQLKVLGLRHLDEIVGKTDYDFRTEDVAKVISQNDMNVIQTGEMLVVEESDIEGGNEVHYMSKKLPLRNKAGKIIGIVGISFDMSQQINEFNELMKAKEEKERTLEEILAMVPGHVYWKNLEGRYIGCNNLQAVDAGFCSGDDMVGMTDYDMPWKEDANFLREIDAMVIASGELIVVEEKSKIADGTEAIWLSRKTPLKDTNGNIIGLLGVSIDITDRKEKERLEIESLNIQHQATMEAQKKFRKAVGQMMHDITSPVTSINTIVSKLGSQIPENDRVTLRAAADRVEGISQRLLKQYENKVIDEADKIELLPVSLALLQIMSEKKEESLESSISFAIEIEDNARFCFIQHAGGIFKRMISNLVNNAVDALKSMDQRDDPLGDSTAGNSNRDHNLIPEKKVTIKLSVSSKSAIIAVVDNGPGMPEHIQDLFNQGASVSEGKGDAGHGIGLTQIHDAITTVGKGRFEIYASELGTEIIMYFPLAPVPHWIATDIKIKENDAILILDDDDSIHGAWDHKFVDVLADNPGLSIQHFRFGKDVIEHINKLTLTQKQNTFLLTDYELLEQNMNGLDVVEEAKMLRSILVTSYATNPKIQERVTSLGIKTLPKELVSGVEIKVEKKLEKGGKVVDMVWVEDQAWYVDGLVKDHYSHLKVDVFYDPVSFMESVVQYPLDTRIILDTYYEYGTDGKHYKQTGYDLAKELHDLGYTKLILLAGEDPKGRAPEYLQVVRKKDGKNTENLNKI